MRLVVQSGNQTGQVFELNKDTVTLGRDVRCDVVISDAAASRNHCQIRRDPGGWTVQDLGSTNGTVVNGERISGARSLPVGSTITIGKTTLLVEESQTIPAFVPPQPVVAQVPIQPPPASGSNTTMWLVFGGVVIVLLLIGIVITAVILMQPAPTPIAAVLPSLTPTVAPTATPAMPTVTLIPTQVVTATIAVTTTRECIECTRTPTPTFTPTSTPTPTATPTRFFPDLFIIRPPDKAKFGQSDTIILQWMAADNLRPLDEYYVQVSTHGDFQNDLVCTLRTKQTQINLPNEGCAGNMVFNAIYYWRVQIIAPGADGKPVTVSGPGQVRQFGWQP